MSLADLVSDYSIGMGDCCLGRPFVDVRQARANLKDVYEASKDMVERPLVAFGTLWTILRDGDIHPKDHDVDFIIFHDAAEEFVQSVLPVLVAKGFTVGRVDGDLLLSLCRGTEYVDIYWAKQYPEGWRIGGGDYWYSDAFFQDTKKLQYRGMDLDIPNEAVKFVQEYVAFIWKRDWRINHYLYSDSETTLLSIMTPTIFGREEQMGALLDQLMAQATEVGQVEILLWKDVAGEHTTGAKRQQLVQEAHGLFCAFVDDDDFVSDTYVRDIVEAITPFRNDLDVVGFHGEVHFTDGHTQKMVHSINCPEWTEEHGVFFRPPNHLNPIRTKLARMVPYEDITYSEDFEWSIKMKREGLLRREVFLGAKPLYFYECGSVMKGL